MKLLQIALIAILITSCQTKKVETNLVEKYLKNKIKMEAQSFFVGTYTDSLCKGIYNYTLAQDGSLKLLGLVAISDNPSFLTKSTDGKYVLAVNEINSQDGAGTIESYAIENDSLIFISRSPSGGAHPCFVATNDASYILTANYTGGNVGLLKLNTKGEISNLLDIQQHTGKGVTERQDAPHAHSAWFEANSNNIISIDLGTNELWFSKLDTVQQKLVASKPKTLKMAPGDGPRHLTFHPNNKWIYVVNELNGNVALLEKNKGTLAVKSVISTLPEGYEEPNTCADIHISSDGKFVYASNRGHNSIVTFKVNEADGTLTFIAHESTRGDGPRNFSLSPDEAYLVVANQLTQNIISFKRDKDTGLLEFVDEIEAPNPVCILFK